MTIASGLLTLDEISAAEWSIPLAGNAYRTAPTPGQGGMRRGGAISWSDPKEVYSIFFHVDRPAELTLAIRARNPEGQSQVTARINRQDYAFTVDGTFLASHPVGSCSIPQAGYVQVDFFGVRRSGPVYAEIQELLVESDTDGLTLHFVESNQGNMFYWGRRGPSVHLGYRVPRDRHIQYAYSEITVPAGQDAIGSYFMANGFGEGYFGMQVNSARERRVLFSVWSPFKTDNPKDIPPDQRIIALAKGPGVRLGEFGNEGSGGQSILVYPWKADTTYAFLTEVRPDGQGSTVYTSWFAAKPIEEWKLIASFRRPHTNTHLRGFHSFLENFNPGFGHIERRAYYGNVWVRDTESHWHECTGARFTVDATGGGQHRLDFTGGSQNGRFFLRHCGFFDQRGEPGRLLTRESNSDGPPTIDFEKLPRSSE